MIEIVVSLVKQNIIWIGINLYNPLPRSFSQKEKGDPKAKLQSFAKIENCYVAEENC